MQLYDINNKLILSTEVDDDSQQFKEIMGENSLTLKFSLPEYIDFPIGLWCEFLAEKYMLFDPANFTKQHTEHYDYSLKMHTDLEKSKQVKFKFFTLRDVPGQAVTLDAAPKIKFSLTASPLDFARLWVNNMNLESEGGWTVGDCISSDPVTLDFNGEYCYNALAKFADAFNTEWEVVNKTLHLRKVERLDNKGQKISTGLQYGYQKGILPGIERVNYNDKRVVNRVWIQGGDRNIDRSAYKNDTLLMPKSSTFTYEGISYRTDSTGSYVERTNRTGLLSEDSLDLSKIYPNRVGTVSAVFKVDDEKGQYDIADSSIPANLDFSKMSIKGEKATIIFQTGLLAGKEFDIETDKDGNLTGYKHAERKFQLVPIEENGLVYPQGALIPAVGDKYAVFHIALPQSYINDAELKARDEAAKYLYENSLPKFTYRWNLDGIYARVHWNEIGGKMDVGYFVTYSDSQFLPEAVDIRITSVKTLVNKPKKPVISISNEVSGKTVKQVIEEMPSQETTIERSKSESIQFTKRNFRDAMQTVNMLQHSLLNFSEGINPITVQTMSLLVGDPSLQYRFVTTKNNTAQLDTAFQITYDGKAKRLKTSKASICQHMTLGISDIKNVRDASEYYFWDVQQYQSAVLTDTDTAYYLYLKVPRAKNSAEQGVFLLSEKSIKIDSVSGYYHLLAGILNSQYEGQRSYVDLYGFTEVVPGRITTDRIVSNNGMNYFDLVRGAIRSGVFNAEGVMTSGIDVDPARASQGRPVTILKGAVSQSLSGDQSLVPTDRGSWKNTTKYFAGDLVQHNGSSWIVKQGWNYVSEEPKDGSTFWQKYASKGADGLWLKYQYAKSSSSTTAPSSGWQDYAPAVGTNEYLWVRTGYVQPPALNPTKWDNVYMATGKNGRIFTYRGEYNRDMQTMKSKTVTYKGTPQTAEVVMYNKVFYYTKDTAGSFSNIPPTNTNYWEMYGSSFESVATSLLFAEKALIAGFNFYNDRIESVKKIEFKKIEYPAVTIKGDEANGYIELNSLINRWTSSNNYEVAMQTINIDSRTGNIIVSTSDDNRTVLSSQGFYTNRAGIDVPKINLRNDKVKAASVNIGRGEMSKNRWDNGWGIVGVYGKAENKTEDNPAPAYGGWFEVLKANGLCLSVLQIWYDTELSHTDCYVSCYNKVKITIKLPPDPYTGQILYLRQMEIGRFTIHSNQKDDKGKDKPMIHTDGNVVVSIDNRSGQGDTTMLVYDGQYWCLNYMVR